MRNLCECAQEINDSFFKLMSVYDVSISTIDRLGLKGDDVDFLKQHLDPVYILQYIDVIKDYVFEKTGELTEVNMSKYIDGFCDDKVINFSELYNRVSGFNNKLCKELREVEADLESVCDETRVFSICCEEMRNMADQIDECLHNLSRVAVDDIHNECPLENDGGLSL